MLVALNHIFFIFSLFLFCYIGYNSINKCGRLLHGQRNYRPNLACRFYYWNYCIKWRDRQRSRNEIIQSQKCQLSSRTFIAYSKRLEDGRRKKIKCRRIRVTESLVGRNTINRAIFHKVVCTILTIDSTV